MRKITDNIIILIIIFLVGDAVYKIVHRSVANHNLKSKAVYTKAVIIDEKNYYGHHSVSTEFTFSYKFVVDGKSYTGDSHNQNLRVGDSVEVEYVEGSPGMNKPLNPTE